MSPWACCKDAILCLEWESQSVDQPVGRTLLVGLARALATA